MSGTRVSHGSQTPRIVLVPDGDEHPDLVAALQLVREAGIVLDPWQDLVFRSSLLRHDGRWAAFAVAVCCPRQNGKNALLEAIELAALFVLGERMIVHSAHQADTAKEAFRRLVELIEGRKWLDDEVQAVRYTNGHEAIELKSGQRIRFRTRTGKGGRGFTGNRVIFDEAMFLSDQAMGSMLPVISAQPDPQIWYTGSAVDQYVHEDGVQFARVRERALAGDDPRLAYFEWSVDADTPDDVTDEMAGDLAQVAVANPALGIRIAPEYVEAERRELDARTFAVERLGAGDWPPTDNSVPPVIDLAAWDELATAEPPGQLVALAFDVSPDQRSASICGAYGGTDGRPVLAVIDRRRDAGWVVEALKALSVESDAPVLFGKSSPAEAFVTQLEEAGFTLAKEPAGGLELGEVSTGDHAKACGLLVSLVNADGLRQLPDDGMRAALKGAARKPYGDAWLWSRRHSQVDISPLVGCTLSCWGAAALGWDGEADFQIW